MKRKHIIFKKIAGALSLAVIAVMPLGMAGCQETIDSSNFAIADEPTVYDYLANDERFSDIVAIFNRVKTVDVPDGSNYTSSSIANTLQTRGNYTCFIPTNDAVRAYVQELTGSTDVASLSDEQAENIAKNCLIDNGDLAAYESPDFPTNGSFAISNMADRILTCQQVSPEGEETTEEAYYMINGEARVLEVDIQVSNGYVHVIDHVIAPSSNTVADMIKQAGNMRIFGRLLEVTGWDVRLTDYRDEEYELRELDETESAPGGNFSIPVMQTRYLGYTAFAETDDVYASQWGVPAPQYDEASGEITNWSEIESIIAQRAAAAYPDADASAPLNDESNPVNRFVAYHLLEGRVAYDRFVQHYNEYGFRYLDPAQPAQYNYTVNVWDYYTTLGEPRGLMKVLQTAEGDYPIYINRICTYNNDTYQEEEVTQEGVRILPTNGEYDNNALNGFYYPITGILTYDETTRARLANERIRIDMTTMLPEMSSNNLRGGKIVNMPTGYFNNIFNESSGTRMFYYHMSDSRTGDQWRDAQGDEFIMAGVFDFVMKLPPVPRDGTYEIRMGVSLNPYRGMAQIYFGDDPNNLQPAGLPVDLRQEASNNPNIPWVEDSEDEVVNRENDKNLRNQGWMKGPKYFMICNGLGAQGGTPLRDAGGARPALRRIITTENLEADKTYYMRFKSALDSRDAQFFMDYFEFVNSSVYNGADPEDVW